MPFKLNRRRMLSSYGHGLLALIIHEQAV